VYMPMILELVVTLLACSRLGVIHSVVVSNFFVIFRSHYTLLTPINVAGNVVVNLVS